VIGLENPLDTFGQLFFLEQKKRLDKSHEISFGILIVGQKQDEDDTRNL